MASHPAGISGRLTRWSGQRPQCTQWSHEATIHQPDRTAEAMCKGCCNDNTQPDKLVDFPPRFLAEAILGHGHLSIKSMMIVSTPALRDRFAYLSTSTSTCHSNANAGVHATPEQTEFGMHLLTQFEADVAVNKLRDFATPQFDELPPAWSAISEGTLTTKAARASLTSQTSQPCPQASLGRLRGLGAAQP